MLINLNDKKYSELSEDELNKLFVEYKNGSMEAKNEIILHNIRLVIPILKRFDGILESIYDDLFQIGCIGLSKAVDSFDNSKNTKFSTYATILIRNEIFMYLRQVKKNEKVGSLNELISFKDNDVELQETISDDSDFTLQSINKELCKMVNLLVLSLNEKSREVIKLYYGFYGRCYNQTEISSIVGISQAQVCRVIKSSLAKLKTMLKENGMEDYDFGAGKTITKF